MANIAIFRINYKSDFILTLNSDAGWMTPFCIKFWTGAPSQAYFVGYDGMTYTHCAPVDGEPTKLLVQFDDHHLPIGDLKFQIGYHFTVADFPTSVEDEVINQASVIIEQDGEPAQVMLDFNGETAPEIQFSLPAYANEAQRIANEQARIAAEQQRIANEDARIAAEQTRQLNEAQRIAQETVRVNEFATLKSQSQAATSAANTAAALANEKAQLAADKAALADAAATLANEKAQLAADKAALAQAAATLANDKADLAQQKAAYAQTQGDYAKAQGDYAKAQGDTAQADHVRAEADHTTAAADHTTAAADHTTAAADHNRAENDHTTAASDHTRAESDHTTAASDHSRAEADHTTAASDHSRAESDHTTAATDHTTAQADHAQAVSDHAAVEPFADSLGAYDISAAHASGGVLATYADLTAALGTNGANIPEGIRKGGMSVKFVQTSDNKYVQYRYMLADVSTAATFTNAANWQDMGDFSISQYLEPQPGTNLLNKNDPNVLIGKYIDGNNIVTAANYNSSGYVPVSAETTYYKATDNPESFRFVNFYTSNGIFISKLESVNSFTTPENTAFVRVVIMNTSTGWTKAQIALTSVPYIAYNDGIALKNGMGETPNSIVPKSYVDALGENVQQNTSDIDNIEHITNELEVQTGVNLLDKNAPDVLIGKFINGTTISSDANYNSSGYVPVSAETTYYKATDNLEAFRFVNFYRSDKTLISTIESVNSFTTPANTAYVRVSIFSTYTGWTKAQIALTSVPYESYISSLALKHEMGSTPNSVVPKSYVDALGESVQQNASDIDNIEHITNQLENQVGVNLLDKNAPDVLIGKIVQGNDIASDVRYNSSGYVPVSAETTYYKATDNSESFRIVNFYKSDKTYISKIESVNSFTTPENTAFVRVVIMNTSTGWTKAQIALTSVPYTPYNNGIALRNGMGETPDSIVPKSYVDELKESVQQNASDIDNMESITNELEVQTGVNLLDKNDPNVLIGKVVQGNVISTMANYNSSGYIPVSAETTYYKATDNPESFRIVNFYKSDKTYISNLEYANSFTTPANTAFVRVVILNTGTGWDKAQVALTSVLYSPYTAGLALKNGMAPTPNAIATKSYVNENIGSGNMLFGKKWAPLGDSFTEGATNSTIESGKYAGRKKVYPYFIGNRSEMNILSTFFKSGRTLAFPAVPGDFTNSICNPSADCYYQNIPADVDYITIYLGINDSHHAPGGSGGDGESNEGEIPIGTISDNTTSTYYGAWNVVLTWLRTNRPFAHIGIIVSNGCDTMAYRLAQIAVAEKYGIPYLDLNGDARCPAMIRAQNNSIPTSIKTIIAQNQAVDYEGGNLHPNDDAHLFESYFIENWLKAL